MKSLLITVTILTLINACHAGKTTVNQATATTTMNDTAPLLKTDTLPLMVQFYSIGEGIDGTALGLLDAFMVNKEKELGKSITGISVPWGREGEFDKCYRLANLNAKQRKNLISELRKIFNDKNLVHIKENEPCKHFRF